MLLFAEERCRHATVLESGDHLQVSQALRKSLFAVLYSCAMCIDDTTSTSGVRFAA